MDLYKLDFPIYYINLNEQTKRNINMINLFEKNKINKYVRIEAFDYKKNNIIPNKLKHPDPYIKRDVNLAEHACFTSHIFTLKKFIETTNKPYCFVFEDDINFDFSKYYCDTFSNYILKMPNDTDILQLQFLTCKDRIKNIKNPNFYTKGDIKYNFMGTSAYLITRKYAKKILEGIEFYKPNMINYSKLKYAPVADWYLYNFTNKRYVIPLVNISLNNDSTINPDPDSYKFQYESSKLVENLWITEFIKCKSYLSNLPTIYYINRDCDIERKWAIEKQLKKFNLKFKRIEAKTPNNCSYIKQINTETIDNREKNDLTEQEYCVTASHIKCLLEAKKNNLDEVLILEDDCSFGFVCYYKKSFCDYIKELDDDCNFIRLMCQGYPLFNLNEIKFTKEDDVNWRSNAGYYINKKGVDNILSCFKIKDNIYDFSDFNGSIIADVCFQKISKKVYNIPLLTLNFSFSLNSTIRPDKNWGLDYLKEQKYIRELWEKSK